MRISVKAIISYRDKFLLLRPKNLANSVNGWDIPGGTVEGGEMLEQTLVREVREETGLELKRNSYVQTVILPNSPTRYEIFLGEVDEDLVELSPEHTAFQWVDALELKRLTGFDVQIIHAWNKLQK